MGFSGSWLLFTGLVGAWCTAVLMVPRVKRLDERHRFMTYPDFLRWRYGRKVATLAALISGVGYLGFTGAQILAGAKLAAGTILAGDPFGVDSLRLALVVIAVVTILYTVIGGLKAVIYTDTIQWLILLGGLILVAIPATLVKVGGWTTLRQELPPEFFSLGNIAPVTFINWMATIIPIWFIGMTLYQRIYACRDEKDARRAWYVAGFFEYPVMAFTGVFLGMCARLVFPEAESEMALPMLIREVLPVGVVGVVLAAYFSAIMSTADSCLMASSGNFVNDIIERLLPAPLGARASMRLSMLATLVIGVAAVVIAARFKTVLDAILYAYAFMVAGLFVPTLGAHFWPRGSAVGAMLGMIGGGCVSLALLLKLVPLPGVVAAWGLDASVYGMAVSLVLYVGGSLVWPSGRHDADEERTV
jgi:SSS family solute:Na+ symporter